MDFILCDMSSGYGGLGLGVIGVDLYFVFLILMCLINFIYRN